MHSRTVSCFAVLVLALTSCARTSLTQPPAKGWPYGGGDWGNTRYSPLKKINAANVRTVRGAWVKKLKGESSTATPLVREGVMYIVAGAHVYALDAATGAERWSYQADTQLTPRAVTLSDDMVFVGTRTAHMLAIDLKTGALRWNTMIGDPPERLGQMISGAPGFADGIVVCALANGDFGLRGRVLGLDAKTGSIKWRFETIPGPGEPGHETWPDNDEWKKGGAGVWTPPAFDPQLGLVFLGVGNAVPQWGGEVRPGNNLYTASVIALELKTGKLRWYNQLVHHDIWDHDVGTPLILYDAEVKGAKVRAVAAMRTDAYLFALDRATGKYLYPVEERAVPQNAYVHTAPTQPFPVGAEAVGPRCVEEDMVPSGFAHDCYFDVVDDRPNIMALIMAARSAPMSFDPDTGYFYVTISVAPFWVKHGKDPAFFYYTGVVPDMKQYGILAALDSRTSKIVWQQKLPYKIQNGSGVLSTAGGLVLHGHPDGRLMAFDAKSGMNLWEFQLGSGADGPVVTYEVDGEQHIAIAAREAIWSLKLNGKLEALAPQPAAPTVTSFVGTIEDADQVVLGSTLSDGGLNGKRTEPDPYGLEPQRARTEAGGTLKFINKTDLPHHLKALDGSWDTGVIKAGESRSIKFTEAGVTTYICVDHPWTYGEVTIE